MVASTSFWTTADLISQNEISRLHRIAPPLNGFTAQGGAQPGEPLTIAEASTDRLIQDLTIAAQCEQLLGMERARNVHDRTVMIEAWEILNREHVRATFQEICRHNTALERFDWGLTWYSQTSTVTLWRCVAYPNTPQPVSIKFMWSITPSCTLPSISTP